MYLNRKTLRGNLEDLLRKEEMMWSKVEVFKRLRWAVARWKKSHKNSQLLKKHAYFQ